MDTVGDKAACAEISQIKVVAPNGRDVIDRAIQVHGGAGVSDDSSLAAMFADDPLSAIWPTDRTRCIAKRWRASSWRASRIERRGISVREPDDE